MALEGPPQLREAAAEGLPPVRDHAHPCHVGAPTCDRGQAARERSRAARPQARVAMVTDMGQQSIVMDAIKRGARDFVVKPFAPDRVIGAVNKLLAV